MKDVNNFKIILSFMLCAVLSPYVLAEEGVDQISFQLLSEQEKGIAIDKKPELKCSLDASADPENITAYLDDTDITALLKWQGNYFVYKPVTVLEAGEHTLDVIIDNDDETIEKSFSFESRHSESFKTLQANIGLGLEGSYRFAKKPDEAQDYQFDSMLGIEMTAATEQWENSFVSHVTYTDPNSDDTQFALNDYLYTSTYTSENLKGVVEVGDVTIDETENTVSGFSRRGLQSGIEYKDFSFNVFSVAGESLYGFKGGTGIGVDNEKNVIGLSAGQKFVEDRAHVKVVYLTGGTPQEGMGVGSSNEQQKGDTLGLVADAELISQWLLLKAEVDFSSFDNDVTAGSDSTSDHAWRIDAGGQSDEISYSLYYLYTGADYATLGNNGLNKDKLGYGADFGFQNENHSFQIALSRVHDNVEDVSSLPTVYATGGSFQYSYLGMEDWQWSFMFEKMVNCSTDEPQGTEKIDTDENSASLNLSLYEGLWTHNFDMQFLLINDGSDVDNNEQTFSVLYGPSYAPGSIHLSSVTPTLSYIKDEYDFGDGNSDIYAMNLDITGDLIEESLSYSLNGSVEYTTFDHAGDTNNYNGSGRLEYFIPVHQIWMERASCGLKFNYAHTEVEASQGQQLSKDEQYAASVFLNLPISYLF